MPLKWAFSLSNHDYYRFGMVYFFDNVNLRPGPGGGVKEESLHMMLHTVRAQKTRRPSDEWNRPISL